jgi:hypothetical protein
MNKIILYYITILFINNLYIDICEICGKYFGDNVKARDNLIVHLRLYGNQKMQGPQRNDGILQRSQDIQRRQDATFNKNKKILIQ